MAEWLDFEHPGPWRRIQSKRNAIAFEHPQTGEEVRVLRRVFPTGSASEYRFSYCIRYIASDGETWTDVFSTRKKSKVEPVLRHAMAQLDAASRDRVSVEFPRASEY